MKPKFASELSHSTYSVCKDINIGIRKGSMCRLLIRKDNGSNSNIWLYSNRNTNFKTKIYSLGVIPVGRIIATNVMKLVVKRIQNVNLNSTNSTRIIALQFPGAEQPLAITALIPNTVCDTPGYASLSPDTKTFTDFASGNEITRATLRVVCDQCNKNIFKTVHERSHFC